MDATFSRGDIEDLLQPSGGLPVHEMSAHCERATLYKSVASVDWVPEGCQDAVKILCGGAPLVQNNDHSPDECFVKVVYTKTQEIPASLPKSRKDEK